MTKPTIDEMQELMAGVIHDAEHAGREVDGATARAIGTILEQHRGPWTKRDYKTECANCGIPITVTVENQYIVRAFVEQVEKRWQEQGAPYWSAIDEELAAMEKE